MQESSLPVNDNASPKAFPEIKLGIYRHFKGNMYRVHGIAQHSEDRDQYFVVYESLAKRPGPKFNIRPFAMFVEDVDRDGYKGPRFQFLSEE